MILANRYFNATYVKFQDVTHIKYEIQQFMCIYAANQDLF